MNKASEVLAKINESKSGKKSISEAIKNVDYLEINANGTVNIVYESGDEELIKPSQVFLVKGNSQYDLDTVLKKF